MIRSKSDIVVCAICGHKYIPAKSKRSARCPNCIHIEQHGESIADAKRRQQAGQAKKWREKARAKQKKKPVAPRQRIAQRSQKGAVVAREVAAVKRELKENAADGAFVQCQGCLRYFQGIDASHRVPVSQSLALAADSGNIDLLCRDCHNAWEHGTIPQMIELNCFVEAMHYLFDMDPERFWKIFYRCLDEQERAPTPKLARIITAMEAFEAD